MRKARPIFDLSALERRVFLDHGFAHGVDDDHGAHADGDVVVSLPFTPTRHQRHLNHVRHMKHLAHLRHLKVLARQGKPVVRAPLPSNPLSSIPALNSNPGAPATIYLDFDGNPQTTWGSYTAAATPAYDRDGATGTFSDAELANIQEIWARVAEAYAPFDVNVTTVDPGALVDGQSMKVVIGGSGAWLGRGAGGVAYLGAFYNGASNVAWAFPGQLGNGFPKYVADCIAHEAGHTFGLQHQSQYSGTTKTAEYRGAANGVAPIMGVSYYANRAKWSNGQSAISSGTLQDDMAVIANNSNGFGYRDDDHGDVVGGATALDVSGDQVSGSGVITTTGDVDVFSVVTLAGSVSFTVAVGQYGPTLDATLKLLDADGNVIATSDTTNLGETVQATVADGSYRVVVSSKGAYGDVGAYTVSGQIIPSADYVPAPSALAATTTQAGVALTWSDNSANETAFHVERSDDGGSTWNNLADLAADVEAYVDATATVGQTYRYRLFASGPVEDSGYSNTLTFAVTPAVPANFAAASVSASRIDLSWDDVSGETGYVVERSPNGTTWSSLTTLGADVDTYSNTALTAATRYFYRVRATSAAGNSANASAVNAYTRTAAPALTATVASASQINLTWTNVAGETGYRVERSADGNTWTTLASPTVNSIAYSHTGLTANTAYHYRVFAINAGGDSAPGTAMKTTLLAAPGGLAASAASVSQINLTWSDATGETGYRLERSLNQTTWTLVADVAADVTGYANTGLVAGTNYYYRLRALSASGPSAPGTTASALTYPAAPALTATAFSTTQINLSWTNVAGETGYRVETSTDGNAWSTLITRLANVVTYSHTGLTANTPYYYRVFAINGTGDSAAGTTSNTTLLSAPSGLAASAASTTQINLTWDDSTGETAYRLERTLNNSVFTLVATLAADVTEYENTGLIAGTNYFYRLRAVNAGGASAQSLSANAVTIPAVPALSAAVVSDTSVRLNWTNVSGETNYVVQRSADGSTGWTTIASPTANVVTYTDTGLTADTDYYYRVYAHNASGDSANSSTAASHTLLPTVTGLTATAASTTQVDLAWDDSTGETGYRVERSLNGTTYTLLTTLSAGVTQYANTGLAAGTTYYYRVRAVNAGGPSLMTGRATGLTKPAATAVTAASLSTTQIRLAWTNVAGESGYRIERSPDNSTWSTLATAAANVVTYTNSGLTEDTLYYYRVTPLNASGDAASTTVNRRTLLSAPSGLAASAASATTVNLTWDDSTGETGYKLERFIGTRWTLIASPAADATSYTATGLLAGRSHSFRLRAVNAGGESLNSATASATTPLSGPTIKRALPFQSARLIGE